MKLGDSVRMVRAPNPSVLTLEGTNTYIVGTIVIDPGPNIPEHLEAVLDEAPGVSLVVLTHAHPDHAQGAATFADMARAPLASFRDGIADGQVLGEDGVTLRALHTPGHSSDHLCFFLEEGRALFSGDHVLGRGTSVVAHPDGDMAAYMASLERVRALQPARVYPGHGPVVEDPAGVLDHYIAHRLEREQQVLDAMDAGATTVGEMVKRIYADYPVALHPAAGLSVMAHLEKLRHEGRAHSGDDGRWTR